jgi:GTPase SAR1 family protein
MINQAGQEIYKAITRGYYRSAIGAIICYDITSQESFNNVTKWIEEARMNAQTSLNFVLVGNKSDKIHE